MSTTGLVDTKQEPGGGKRRQYSEASKRRMVAETQLPGASVSTVARRYDVNSNQLFRWRRQLLPKAAVEGGAGNDLTGMLVRFSATTFRRTSY